MADYVEIRERDNIDVDLSETRVIGIGGEPAIDNVTITKNANYELQAVGITDGENVIDYETINGLIDDVDTAKTDIININNNIDTIESDLSTAQGNISTLQNDISTINSNIQTIEGDIDNIEGDVDAINDDIDTINNNIQTLSDGLQEAQQDIQEINTELDNISEDVADLETNVADLEQGLQDVEGDVSTLQSNVGTLTTDVNNIKNVIPDQASSSNKLADKAFVNSTIQTATANFRGNWMNWASVPMNADEYPADYTGTKTPSTNDYMVVQDASGYVDPQTTLAGTWRFKYTGVWVTDGRNGWHPEYQVNETPLTAAQLAALNSGITSEGTNQIETNRQNIANLQTSKQDKIDTTHKLDADLVDDSTSTNKFVTEQDKQNWNAKQDAITSSNKLSADLVEDGTTNKVFTSTDKTKLDGIDLTDYVKGVKIAGNALTPDADGKVNIPIAGNSVKGVVDVRSAFGCEVDQYGRLQTVKASNLEIDDKTNERKVIVPNNLDYAVKVAVTTNTNVLTASEKAAAHSWLDIPTITVSATGTATDEVQYITIDGVEKKLAGGGGGTVTTTDKIEQNNTNPVTSGGLYNIFNVPRLW